ncbi:Protein 21.1 [Giardia lamblia P15]|uniref:Protein 21.1 n=1 Tax=Giardia intestinalis (strain P15) TaxID=658858 RepID=E1EZS3_GIAIA|nr:Protein 21.1 [Giardia lamblia P15]
MINSTQLVLPSPLDNIVVAGRPAVLPTHNLVGYLKPLSTSLDSMSSFIQSSKLNGDGILTSYSLVVDEKKKQVYSFEQYCHGMRLDQVLQEQEFQDTTLTEIELWKLIVGISLALVKLIHNYQHSGIQLHAFFTFSEEQIYYDSYGHVLYRPAYVPLKECTLESNTIKSEQQSVARLGRFIQDLASRYCSKNVMCTSHLPILLKKMVGQELSRPSFAAICALENMGDHIRSSLIEAGSFNWDSFSTESVMQRDTMENTPLFDALEIGDSDLVHNQLRFLKKANLKGRTALMHAACNQLPIPDRCYLLVSAEACCQDSDGWTALMHAIDNQHFELAQLLLEREAGFIGKDTCIHSDLSGSQLSSSVQLSLLGTRTATVGRDMTIRLLSSSANLNSTSNQSTGNMTALILAVINYCYEMVRYLAPFESGYQDRNGYSALMHALDQRDFCEDVCKVLAVHDGGSVSKNGRFGFKIAALQGRREICQLLIEKERNLGRSKGFTSLHYAIAVQDDKMFNHYLYKYGSSRDADGVTPLMLACIFNDVHYVKALLTPNPDSVEDSVEHTSAPIEIIEALMPIDSDSMTALDYAVSRQSYDSATALLEILASHLNIPFPFDNSGIISVFRCLEVTNLGIEKLLHYAVDNGLLQHLDDPKQKRVLSSVWFKAVETGTHVAIFIMRNIYKRILNSNGKTALMEAAYRGDLVAVKLLSVEATFISIQGLTALMYAIIQGYDDIVYHLAPLENSVYTNSSYHEGPGISPLEIALKHDMTRYIDVLS